MSNKKNNLDFWNNVCTTDPKHTKPVTFGRTFTAIDPMYQIMKATEAMGVAGEGWGFSIEDTIFLPTDQVAMKVRVWKGKKENYIEQWGQNGLYTDNNKTKPDADCMKKATTDGVTKCLTYFGFNADVFLGKFDDNKYVQALKDEAKKEATPTKKSFKTIDFEQVAALVELLDGNDQIKDGMIKSYNESEEYGGNIEGIADLPFDCYDAIVARIYEKFNETQE